jgi:hypothetical protein
MAHRTSQRARCIRTPFNEVECTIPFHAELIATWKHDIPFNRRSYDPDTKAWRFWGGYEDLAIALLLECFPDANIPRGTRTGGAAPTRTAGNDHFATLHLLPSAPIQVVKAAYRALAKLHHPDVNGDTATMRRLTEAHDTLSRRLSA